MPLLDFLGESFGKGLGFLHENKSFLGIFVFAAVGAPVAYDSFESYTVGSSISGSNEGAAWFGDWGTDEDRDAEISVVSGGLNFLQTDTDG